MIALLEGALIRDLNIMLHMISFTQIIDIASAEYISKLHKQGFYSFSLLGSQDVSLFKRNL